MMTTTAPPTYLDLRALATLFARLRELQRLKMPTTPQWDERMQLELTVDATLARLAAWHEREV